MSGKSLSVTVKITGSEKSLAFKTWPGNRVIDLKQAVLKEEGIDVKYQRLIFGGRSLENQSLLKSCGVVDGSPIHCVPIQSCIQIIVKTLTGKIFTVYCGVNDKVEQLKHKIHDKEGIPPNQQQLVFGGRLLANQSLLESYGVVVGSTIHCIIRSFQIIVKTSTGKRFSVNCGVYDKVEQLKHKIHDKEGIPPNQQRLILAGRGLADQSLLKSYGVVDGDTIHCAFRHRSFQISVAFLTGKRFSVNCDVDDKVEQFKRKIYDKEGIPPNQQKLIFLGVPLANQSLLENCGVRDGSTIHCVLIQSCIQIIVKTVTGKIFTVNCDEDGKVEQLQLKIQEQEGIPPYQQRLIFRGRPLADQSFLKSYGVVDGDTIHCVFRHRSFQISVAFLTGKRFSVDCDVDDKVEQLKDKVHDKEGIPPNQQRLIYRGLPLANQSLLKSCGLIDGSTIHCVLIQTTIQIFVHTLMGKRISVRCNEDDKVEQLKLQIEEQEGTPHDQQRLIIGGIQLEDGKPLRHYNIRHESVLFMALRLCGGGFPINVIISDGRLLSFTEPITTVGKLKRYIFQKTGIPVRDQRLLHDGKVLDDASSLFDYVDGESNIYLLTV